MPRDKAKVPASIETEQALLAAILLGSSADSPASVADEAMPIIEPSLFYDDKHRVILKAIRAVWARGYGVDSRMVFDELESMGKAGEVGGATYLTTICGPVAVAGSMANWKGYLHTLQGLALRRKRDELLLLARAHNAEGQDTQYEKAISELNAADAEVAAIAEGRRSSIRLVNMAQVQARAVKWLWEPYIPLECITLLEGDPKTGKTWAALAVTAAITRGFPLPGEGGKFIAREPGKVLYLTAEDSIDMTLKPRLDKGNADTSRVEAFEGKIGRDGKTVVPINMQDLPELDEALEQVKPVLIVIDSMVPHLGPKVDQNKPEQIVPVLNGVARLAEKHSCACLIIRHWKKGPSERALYKGQGTVSIAGVARSILMVGKDPNQPGKGVIVHSACNLAKEGPSQSFAITDAGAWEWCGISELSAAELVAPEVVEQSGARADAKKFLREALAQGPRSAVDMEDEADANGIAPATLKRARKELNIRAFKLGRAWYWELPRPKAKEEDHQEDQRA